MFHLFIKLFSCTTELIETLWNVNIKEWSCKHSKVNELIETLWNVNLTVSSERPIYTRINRNIVECK